MNLKKLLFILSLLVATAAYSSIPVYRNPVSPEFPILAWYSILPDSAQTRERYDELREAGFNISYSTFTGNKQIVRALAAAEGSGVKLIVGSAPLYSDTRATVDLFRDNDVVAGWFLRDEPVAAGFDDLGKFRDRIYDADSSRLMYLNLLPVMVPAEELGTVDYEDYVERFVERVRLPLISYDFYPIVRDDSTGHVYWREPHFENLEIVSRVARRHNMPFWAFCLSTAHHPYPVPGDSHMRFEAFTALAYGAQGIQYFTYWQPASKRWDFHHAPIDETGKRTDVYYMVKNLNREIQALAPVFLGAEVDDVSFIGRVPKGTKALEALPEGFGTVSVDGPGVLVSQFHNGDKQYVMFVSLDIDHSQTLAVNLPAGAKQILPDGTTSTAPQKNVLVPGGYYLVRYE